MGLGDPVSLASGLFIGLVGAVLFLYGKKNARPWPLLAGVVLSVLPLVVSSLALLWGLSAACLGGLFWVSRQG